MASAKNCSRYKCQNQGILNTAGSYFSHQHFHMAKIRLQHFYLFLPFEFLMFQHIKTPETVVASWHHVVKKHYVYRACFIINRVCVFDLRVFELVLKKSFFLVPGTKQTSWNKGLRSSNGPRPHKAEISLSPGLFTVHASLETLKEKRKFLVTFCRNPKRGVP